MFILTLIMATSTLFSATFEGRIGQYAVEILDTEGSTFGGSAEVTDIRFSYGEPRTDFDGARGGRIGSEVAIELLGDDDRIIRDAVDALEDERRFQLHLSGPRGDRSTFHWYGVVQGAEIADALSPSVFPRGEFTVRAVCGLGLLKDRVPVSPSIYSGLPSRTKPTIADVLWQLREAQGPAHGFDVVRAGFTLRETILFFTSPDRLRLTKIELGDDSIEEQIDTICSNFHCSVFQPTSTEAREWWFIPHTRRTGTAQVIDIVSEIEADATGSSWPAPPLGNRRVAPRFWTADGTHGRILASGDIIFEGPGLGQLINLGTFPGGLPTGWVIGVDHHPGVSDDGNITLEEGAVLSQRIFRLPKLENISARIDLSQVIVFNGVPYPARGADAGFAVIAGDGNTYVAGSGAWVVDDPSTNKSAGLLRQPHIETDYAVTPPMPLSDWGGGILVVYLYGASGAPGNVLDSEIKSIEAHLVDSDTGDEVDKLQVRELESERVQARVEIPLITDWERKTSQDEVWRAGASWESDITGVEYFAFASAVAAERRAIHPGGTKRLRWIRAEISGLWTPEFDWTFIAGDDSPFETDVLTRLVACDIDIRKGTTSGTFIEVVEDV